MMMNPAQRASSVICLCGVLALLTGCSTLPPEDVTIVTPFDLSKYAGKWFEIARLDHTFERGLTDINAHYSQRADGRIQVINRGFNTESARWKDTLGVADFADTPNRGALKVSFFWPIYGGYNVVALDEVNYRWSLVMGPNRDYFWILSRDRHLDAELKQTLIEKARKLGINTDQLIWTPQTRSDG